MPTGPQGKPTCRLRPDQIQHLAETVLKWQWFNGHGLQLLTLLLIEVLQLEHGQNSITIQVHTPEPVLYATEPRVALIIHTIYTEALISVQNNIYKTQIN